MRCRFLAALVLIALFTVCMWLCTVSATSVEIPHGHKKLAIRVNGVDRDCLLYVPSRYDKTNALPLVVMLHGMGGTARNTLEGTGWSTKGEQEGFIVAYPEGTRPDVKYPPSLRKNPQSWNDGSGRFHATERKIDDVAFIAALLDRVQADYAIDAKRIYVAGFSNGASMAFRVGAELSDRIAAIAPNAGACWAEKLNLRRGVSLCYITGTADTFNPLEGGFPKLALGGKEQGGRKKPPVQVTIDKWAKALECLEKPKKDETNDGVRRRRYGPGRDGAEVEFITVDGLGHNWAGGKKQAPEFLVGGNSDRLSATDAIWEFLVAHPIR